MWVRRASVAILILLIGASQACAWGPEGHRVIALIAAGQLTAAARSNVAELLDSSDYSEGLEKYSTWADEIAPQRPDTAPWHFVDIEISNGRYDHARDCPTDDCVVAQINQDINILKNSALTKPVRAEALRFLIHFVGDIHQPLHCADNHDRGGNEVFVQIGNETTNLHAVWDTRVVESLGLDPAILSQRLFAEITPAQQLKWTAELNPETWANESLLIAKEEIYSRVAHTGPTDASVILGSDYPSTNAHTAAIQLEKAGVRLARVLNDIFGGV